MLITIIILVLSAVFFVNGKIRSDLVAPYAYRSFGDIWIYPVALHPLVEIVNVLNDK